MNSKTIDGLKRVDGSAIASLNASWESAPISMSAFRNIGIQLGWDDITVTGTMLLQYSCDPSGDGTDVAIWTDKNSVVLDGTFQELLFLDAHLPVGNVRLKWTWVSNSANLLAYITRKD